MVYVEEVLALKQTIRSVKKVMGEKEAKEYLDEIRKTDKDLYDEYISIKWDED